MQDFWKGVPLSLKGSAESETNAQYLKHTLRNVEYMLSR